MSTFDEQSHGLTKPLEEKRMDLDAGCLGKFFGSSENAPTNIAGLVALLLILTGIASILWPSGVITPQEIWKVIIPIITMILGYLFGKQKA